MLARFTADLVVSGAGAVAVHVDADRLVRIELLGSEPRATALPGTTAPRGSFAADVIARLRAYDRGDDPRFDELPLPEATTPFEARVRDALRATALGETLTYGALAARAGSPAAARAVGGALSRNRWPLVVPCHRVVASGGAGGFTGGAGLATKRALLAHEQMRWARAR
jgi:methylated-DNA-[protein]-cysteine S-methyltransferase